MTDALESMVSDVLGDQVDFRSDTPLAILGWDDSAWHALGARIAATYDVETWIEPRGVETVGDLLDWMRALVADS
jgi:hypothetical protein